MSDRITPRPSDAELDASVEREIRDTVAAWQLPVRSEVVPWRERVESGRLGRRRHGLRLVAAAGLAAAALVVVSVSVAWLGSVRSPSAGPSASPIPTTGAPTPSSAAAPSPLPTLATFGGALQQTTVIDAGNGAGGIVDLTSGSRETLDPGCVSGRAFRTPDGGLVLVCVQGSAGVSCPAGPCPTAVQVSLERFDGSARRVARVIVGRYGGAHDPAVGGDQGDDVQVASAIAPDGMTAYIGWSTRRPPSWTSGVDVVDVATGSVRQTLRLPNVPTTSDGAILYAWPPEIAVSPDGSALLVAASRVVGSTSQSTWHGVAQVAGGRVGELVPLPPGAWSGPCASESWEGWASTTVYVLECFDSGPLLRRIDAHGTVLGDTSLAGGAGSFMPPVVAPAAGVLYAWDPVALLLTRIDLASGRVTGSATGVQPTAARPGDLPALLRGIGASIGDWLVPRALAKRYIQPALALSPDGRRAYALGATSGDFETAGSAGIFVFDLGAMTQVGHWDTLADGMSIAAGADGRLVFVAGMPGVARDGTTADVPASVVAYDATSGTVRAIAGSLGTGSWVQFPSGARP